MDTIEPGKCVHMRIQPTAALRVHRHEGVTELAAILRGELITPIGGQALRAKAGQVLIYPAEMPHAPCPVWPETCEWISFWWRGGCELAGIKGPEVRADLNGRIVRQLAWLLDCQPVADAARQRMVESLAYTVVYELGQLARSASGDLAERVRRFLREHLAEPLRLEDIAAGVSVSKYHLVRKFKGATGQTPMRTLAEMRVASARVLLAQTELSLDDVAAHVGLADASHLSHTFRRVAGCTPGSLRRR